MWAASGNAVRWYPNTLKALRKTNAHDEEIVKAYHDFLAQLNPKPKKSVQWKGIPFKFIKEFRRARVASTPQNALNENDGQ